MLTCYAVQKLGHPERETAKGFQFVCLVAFVLQGERFYLSLWQHSQPMFAQEVIHRWAVNREFVFVWLFADGGNTIAQVDCSHHFTHPRPPDLPISLNLSKKSFLLA